SSHIVATAQERRGLAEIVIVNFIVAARHDRLVTTHTLMGAPIPQGSRATGTLLRKLGANKVRIRLRQ
ncbi:MAG: hypothetical protein ABSC37_19930, partial [Xanthobacteraceae bacterium]